MPRAKSLRLKEGVNIFSFKPLNESKVLSRIHVTLKGGEIVVKPELRAGKSISIQ